MTYIGRIAREKNLALLLEAWDLLAPDRGSAKLALVGRGPLEAEIRRREIPGVHVAGLMDGRRALRGLCFRGYLRLSLDTETFGNSLLEAMGSGLPSLVAAGGRSARVFQHGGNAWLVEPNSVPAIAEGLRRLLDRCRAAPPSVRGRAPDRAGAGLG